MKRKIIMTCLILISSVSIKAQLLDQEAFNKLIKIDEIPINDLSANILFIDSINAQCESKGLACEKAVGLAQKCIALSRQSEYKLAFEALVDAQELYDGAHCDKQVLVYIYRAKSFVHHRMKDTILADSFALVAIRMFQPEWANKVILIKLHSHLGREDRGLEDAKAHLDTAYQLAKKYGYPFLEQQALINLGTIYGNIGSLDTARRYFEQALKESKKEKILYHTMTLYNSLAGVSDNNEEILTYVDSAIHYSVLLNDISSRLEYIQNKALFYSNLGEFEKGYDELWYALNLKDTLLSVEKYKAIADVEEKYESEKRLNEIQRFKEARNRMYFGGILMMGLIVLFGYGFVTIRKSRRLIAAEKERSEHLLLNILPTEIADELKAQGHATARDHEQVAILFTDFEEFTQISGQMTATEIVEELNMCFRAFDEICKTYGVEKIKTIGDAYMAVGGLHGPVEGSVKNTVMTALKMQQFVTTRKAERDALNQSAFEMRTGIHTGPVVAGIVGESKFQYDIWGDAVNIANRMESNGVPGKVNISQDTYEQLKDDPDFIFENRGKIEAKGKGGLQMWFVAEHDQFKNTNPN